MVRRLILKSFTEIVESSRPSMLLPNPWYYCIMRVSAKKKANMEQENARARMDETGRGKKREARTRSTQKQKKIWKTIQRIPLFMQIISPTYGRTVFRSINETRLDGSQKSISFQFFSCFVFMQTVMATKQVDWFIGCVSLHMKLVLWAENIVNTKFNISSD